MNLKKTAKEMWSDPLGGLLLILILYTPVLVFYVLLDASWDEDAIYTTVWSFVLGGFFWISVNWFNNYMVRKKRKRQKLENEARQ